MADFSRAVELSDAMETRADSLHLKAGVLKDLGKLEQAEEVRRMGM